MTDFWKSGERHFCTFCKCWLAGNKISINLHESGNHHKSMVKAKLEQLRKANVEKDRQDKQLNETLGQMERSANESFRRDMVTNATNLSKYGGENSPSSSDANLPSKLKRPINQPVQVQCKKAKFVIKTPTPQPVFEPIAASSELNKEIETKTEEKEEKPTANNNDQEGIWYESKTDAQESYYWNDTTGASSWTPPAVYLSIEQQKAKGLKV